jgi:hypothetical protein
MVEKIGVPRKGSTGIKAVQRRQLPVFLAVYNRCTIGKVYQKEEE